MLNTTISASFQDNSQSLTVESDKRVSVSVEDGCEFRIVDVGSEQYKHFTNGDPYLLDSEYREHKVTPWEIKWYDIRDVHLDGFCNAYHHDRVYLTQPVEIKSITLDGGSKAIFTYKKLPMRRKLYKETIVDHMICLEDGETYQQGVDRENEWARSHHSGMLEDD